MSRSRFAIVDVSILTDRRLTLNDLRVFIALTSFMNHSTHSCFPSRRAISKRCGLAETRISTVTARLEKFGYIKKIGRGGNSRSTNYIILKVNENENVGSDCAATQPDPHAHSHTSSKTMRQTYYETNQPNNQKLSAVERVRHANATAIESYDEF